MHLVARQSYTNITGGSPFVSPVPRVGLPGGQMQGLVTVWWELVLHFSLLALMINTSDFSVFFIVLVPCSLPRWHKFWCLQREDTGSTTDWRLTTRNVYGCAALDSSAFEAADTRVFSYQLFHFLVKSFFVLLPQFSG